MDKRLLALAAIALAALASAASAQASDATTAVMPMTGTIASASPFAVDAGPGDQTDPHVYGGEVSYTSQVNGGSAVRLYDIAAGTSIGVPTNGGMDFLSDVGDGGVVYTHLTTQSAIWRYDPAMGTTSEVAPVTPSNRRESRIGGTTLVWQDFDYTGDVRTPEITVDDLADGSTTRLTDDALLDKDPAVSPDGNTIVWTKCQQDSTGCTIWEAQRSSSGWASTALTSAADGDAALPDTDGHVVVYSEIRNGDEDVYWQPAGGGAAHELALSGQQTNPNVSNGVIVFEQLDSTTTVPNYDLYAYDIATNTEYRLTASPQDETLNDVWVSGRDVTVVWTAAEADYNVYGERFTLPPIASDTTPPTVSVDGFADGQQFLVGESAPTVTCSSSDSGSGIAATTGPTEDAVLTANGVGTVTYTCTATDGAGNTATATKSYRVVYGGGAFLGPLQGAPAVNGGHGGRAYPLKWQLTDAAGGYVSALSAVVSIRYQAVSCSAFQSDAGQVDAEATGGSGLRYDSTAQTFVYTWATPKTAGCYVVSVTLDSGQALQANFQLS
ncbi:MAG TPA: PxKF domain-containing protein [Gaiellaceae bacterium]|nr:PxKF domain-containing protein [Gaiellaceae bacterium]